MSVRSVKTLHLAYKGYAEEQKSTWIKTGGRWNIGFAVNHHSDSYKFLVKNSPSMYKMEIKNKYSEKEMEKELG